MSRSRQHFAVGNGAHVMPRRGAHVGERANCSLRLRPAARADGRRASWPATPTPFQLVERRVEFAPLAAGEEAPFERVLKPVVILTVAAPGDFSAGAANVPPVEDGVMPGPIGGPPGEEVSQPRPVDEPGWPHAR